MINTGEVSLDGFRSVIFFQLHYSLGSVFATKNKYSSNRQSNLITPEWIWEGHFHTQCQQNTATFLYFLPPLYLRYSSSYIVWPPNCFIPTYDTRCDSQRFQISDQIRSVAQSCSTLCDPMNRSTPGLPVHHQLLEFTQTHVHRVNDAIQPPHPLSSPSPLAPIPSQHQSLFQWVNSSHEVAKVLEFQL